MTRRPGPVGEVGVQRPGSQARRRDEVVTEEPLEIRVRPPGANEAVRIGVTMRTPGDDFDLAAGFLHTEGLLRSAKDVDSILYCTPRDEKDYGNVVEVRLAEGVAFDAHLHVRNFAATSACGVCGKASLELVQQSMPTARLEAGPHLTPDEVRALPGALRRTQAVFERTGGVHGAMTAVEGTPDVSREDVGRHNAVDKVVGAHFMGGQTPLSDRVLVVSGRAGFEIVQKAAAAGVPVVVAVGAPSSLAVDLANRVGMTLVGFASSEAYNVYSRGHRVQD